MKTNYRILTLLFATLMIGLSSCKKDEYTLGDLTAPSDLVITHTIAGQTTDAPYGDGSGKVVFNITAKDAMSYTVNFGDGSGNLINPEVPYSKTFAQIGTHKFTVTVTAIGKAGITTTAVDTLTVNYAYQVSPEIVTMLTSNSADGKRWVVDKDAAGNMGLGPVSSFTPDYYAAGPNEKAGTGLYTNVYTFTNTNVFVDSTYGKIFGSKVYFARDFDPNLPGEYGGYGNDWILYWPTYTTSYSFSGEAATSSTDEVVYINFQKPGSLGYYIGTQQFQILSITDSTMWLRTVQSDPDVNLAYYVKLKVKQ